MKKILSLFLLSLFPFSQLSAQTNIGGVINDYTALITINNPGCGICDQSLACLNQINVSDASAFSVGDKALIVQLKGATIDQSNSATGGTITDIGNAGNYEFFDIGSISGNTILPTTPLKNSYDSSGQIQLVRVPVYPGDVEITTELQADPWDDATGEGGIIALFVNGDLTLSANVNASGNGYVGVEMTVNGSPDNCNISPTTQFNLATTNTDSWFKGGGIAVSGAGNIKGRAPLGNGGGSGVSGDSGGGGGANYGDGGIGGSRWCNTIASGGVVAGGLGGYGLSTFIDNNNRVFFGGAGGAGFVTSGNSAQASNGGGIVVIRATNLIGNGFTINASGEDASAASTGIDGGGGGGAGGSVAFDINTYSGSLTIDVSGGNGQTLNTPVIHGPGGGGGGGAFLHNLSTVPAGISLNINGGAAGTHSGAQSSNTNGAMNGGNGGIINYYNFVETSNFDSGAGSDQLPDFCDLDSDNDGILDADEDGGSNFDPSQDADADGIPNYLDQNDITVNFPAFVDINGDGVNDVYDTDGDGLADFHDLDSDNDGCVDALEGGDAILLSNINMDGTLDGAINATTGVPNNVDINNGQTIGTSIDNSNFDANGQCDTDNDGVIDANDMCPNFDDSVNADGDQIPDQCDLDDDNDGIPDIIEGVYTCTTVADLNTPGFATNTNLVTGGATGAATLNGLDNGTFNFTASVSGTATWNGGIQIQNQASVGNFIYAQPQNASNASPTNVGIYEFDFPTAVSNFEFFIGGLNNGDQATITAFNGATPITITAVNFSDFSDPVNLVPIGNTVVGNNFDNSPDPLINTFKVTVFGDVDRVVVTSQKSINDPNNVTIGLYSFGYCTALDGIDFDNDGIPNSLDLDSDDDGILDIYEAGGTDSDGDGKVDGFVDADGDGLNDAQDNIDSGSGAGEVTSGTPLPLHNTDMTGQPDYLDIDADDDGIVDNIEGQPTANHNPPLDADDDMDGIDNQYDPDFAGNNAFTPENTDGEDLEDYRDRDSDNDGDDDLLEAWDNDSNGIPSTTPSGMDIDGDGLDDAFDTDTSSPDPDNNQVPTDFPDAQEPGGDRDWRDFADIDNDGVADNVDLDNDNDGIPDVVEGTIDSDSDGIPDYLDLDSDNDGITDAKEAGGIDLDGDGRIDDFVDTDEDGLNDAQDNIDGGQSATEVTNGTPLVDLNSDNDSLPNRIDRDSDDDGIPDVIEAGGTDNNGNGIIDNFTDTDDDGLDDSVDPVGPATAGTPLPDTNSDNDTIVDRLDVDSDNDGLTDTYEAGGTDANGDGRIDGFVDADNDGFTDTVDTDDSNTPTAQDGSGLPLPRPNFDADGRPDYLDQDSDDDGITDTHEAGGADINRDGEIDGFVDANGDGLNDVTATAPLPITNTDLNGNPDHLDIDADNDGIVDNIEGQSTLGYNAPLNADTDNDGIDDQYDIDFAGNNSFPVVNTDGDALEDYRDLDSDNDTIDDVIEGWDVDADGTPETVPANADAEGDGLDDNFDTDDASQDPTNGQVPTDFPDAQLPGGDRDWRQSLDRDGDGVNDNVDLDNDNDGIPDSVEGMGDTDGDGIPDYLDLDSDNDGIPDIIEAGGTDADRDGQIDYPTPGDPMSMNDTNNDGLDDGAAASPLPDTDSDGDGVVDRLDLDADNDGIADIIEAGGTDANGDGEVDYATPGDPMTMLDIDADGFIDIIDTNDNTVAGVNDGGTRLPDFDDDQDLLANRLDRDSDNDGIHDVIESGGIDTNGDGTADDDDNNMDNTGSNGIPTSAGGGNIPTDTGADGSQDYRNLDSDGDGCSDANEAYVSANADGGDGGQYGTGTPAATGAFGLVTAAAYDTGTIAAVTDATDNSGCDVIDTDGDGVLDDQEIADGTDPNDPCDFVIASITEVQSGDYRVADCDGDGVTNETEILDGTNPEDPCDFVAANITETLSGDYLISDCDGDGVTNGTEIADGTDPEDPCDFLETSVTLDRSGDWLTADCDGDMIPNDQENTDGTNPNDPCSNIGGTPPPEVVCDIIIETDLVDPGVNGGIFRITNIEAYPDNDVKIYNRWGILVFETQGYDNASRAFRGISNGRATVQENKELPVGIYFYVINYRGTGASGTKSGYLYVNR